MNTVALETQKNVLAKKILNLSDERIINFLVVFFDQVEQKSSERGQLYHEIDTGLHELREILGGKRQVKSFQQFLDEI